MRAYDRSKHEAMLRRELMRLLADWPSGEHVMPEPTQAQKIEFCEAFIESSKPCRNRSQPV